MKALVFDGKLRFLDDYPQPRRSRGEVLIRVALAGICKTDIEIIKGYMGFTGILGHEFVGTVVESDNPNLTGRRVVGEINCPCGNCDLCRQGLGKHCPNRTVLGIHGRDGAFAELTVLPEQNLHIVPDGVSNEEAVFVEPLAAAFQILEQVNIERDMKVAVIGDGKLGILVAQALSSAGCSPIVLGHHVSKMKLLRNLGIATCLSEACDMANFDFVVECSGSPGGLEKAVQIVKPCGTIVLKSTIAARQSLDLSALVVNEISLIGSRCGPFRRALDALKRGEVAVRPLIWKTFDLADGVRAVEEATSPKALKVLLKIE